MILSCLQIADAALPLKSQNQLMVRRGAANCYSSISSLRDEVISLISTEPDATNLARRTEGLQSFKDLYRFKTQKNFTIHFLHLAF